MPFDLTQFDHPPKRVKKSKWQQPDRMGESLLGMPGAIMVPNAAMIVLSTHQMEQGLHKLGFGGSFLHNVEPTNLDGQYQMWYGTLQFIPRVKFRHGFEGMRMDQILTSSFAHPENWKELILDNTK